MQMEVRVLFGRFVWRGVNIDDVTIHPSRVSRINSTLKVCKHNRVAHASPPCTFDILCICDENHHFPPTTHSQQEFLAQVNSAFWWKRIVICKLRTTCLWEPGAGVGHGGLQKIWGQWEVIKKINMHVFPKTFVVIMMHKF